MSEAQAGSTFSTVLADDHPIVMKGIASLLATTEFDVVATFSDGSGVVDFLRSSRADLVILDVQMPVMTGIEALRTIKREGLPAPVILMTASLTDAEAVEAIQLKVDGLVLKERSTSDLVQCARSVMAGRSMIDPDVMHRALDYALASERTKAAWEALSPREMEISALIVSGHKNRAIAARLGITEGTIKIHTHRIYSKLGVSSRIDLVNFARSHGDPLG